MNADYNISPGSAAGSLLAGAIAPEPVHRIAVKINIAVFASLLGIFECLNIALHNYADIARNLVYFPIPPPNG